MTKLYNVSQNEVVNNNKTVKFIQAMDIFKNQNSVINMQYLLAQNVTIFGNGSTGSNIAVSLAKLGFSDFNLIDRDYLNYHNAISSSYTIKELEEFYQEDQNFRSISILQKLPLKIFNLKNIIKNNNPLAIINTYLSNVKRIPKEYNENSDTSKILNDIKWLYRDSELLNKLYNGIIETHRKVYLFKNKERDYRNNYNINKLDEWFNEDSANDIFDKKGSRIDRTINFLGYKDISSSYSNSGYSYVSGYNAQTTYTDKRKTIEIRSDFQIGDNHTLHHYYWNPKNIIILCTDNLESRFDFIHNLIIMNKNESLMSETKEDQYGLFDKNTIIIDTRVGNTIEGEIIMFRPSNSEEVKQYYKSIINPRENKFEDIFEYSEHFENWVLKDSNTDIKFFSGGIGTCGDSMSIIGAQMVSVIVSSALVQIFGNSLEIDEEAYNKSYAFKLGKPKDNYYGHSEYIV